MRLSDFLDLKTGPQALIRFALYPLLILMTGSLVIGIVSRLRTVDMLLSLFVLILLSPAAYLLREARREHSRRTERRRGAERTPVLPHDGVEE